MWRDVKYLRAVYTDWRESGILSVDQVKAREAKHINQRNASGIRIPEISHSSKRSRVSTKISICEE